MSTYKRGDVKELETTIRMRQVNLALTDEKYQNQVGHFHVDQNECSELSLDCRTEVGISLTCSSAASADVRKTAARMRMSSTNHYVREAFARHYYIVFVLTSSHN